jgi:hypothetical protein
VTSNPIGFDEISTIGDECHYKVNNCTVDLSNNRHFYLSKQLPVLENDLDTKSETSFYYVIVTHDLNAKGPDTLRSFDAQFTREDNQTFSLAYKLGCALWVVLFGVIMTLTSLCTESVLL